MFDHSSQLTPFGVVQLFEIKVTSASKKTILTVPFKTNFYSEEVSSEQNKRSSDNKGTNNDKSGESKNLR